MILTIISFLFVLSILVFVHEFGHYIVAKIAGIGVIRFSIGMPPRLVGFRIGETDYCLSAIPFGGYVKLVGQDDFAAEVDESEAASDDYRGKSRPVQIAVLAAGSIMNLLTAVFIFTMLYWTYGAREETRRVGYVVSGSYAEQIGFRPGDEVIEIGGKEVKKLDQSLMSLYTDDNVAIKVMSETGERTLTLPRKVSQDENFGLFQYIPAVIDDTVDDSPASLAGFEPGDEIVNIGGMPVLGGWYHMSELIHARPDTLITITVLRSEAEVPLDVSLTHTSEQQPDGSMETVGWLGVAPRIETREVGLIEASAMGYSETKFLVVSTFDFLGKLFTGRLSSKLLGGPVLIAQMAGESAKSGFSTLMFFTAFISVNLGVLNLLPLPVLDGGHIMIITIEGVTRRRLSARIRIAIQQAGSIVLLIFMLYITFNDLLRIEAISRVFGGG
jgi:regulator of sigma E protease